MKENRDRKIKNFFSSLKTHAYESNHLIQRSCINGHAKRAISLLLGKVNNKM